MRRRYPVDLVFNGQRIVEVVVDPHYERKHADINDWLILALVRELHGEKMEAISRKGGWAYFEFDRMPFRERSYRLVWCVKDNEPIIGVINCFRR